MRSAGFGHRFGVLIADRSLVYIVCTSLRMVSDLPGCRGSRDGKPFVAGR